MQRACLAMAAIATRGGPDAMSSFTSQAVQLARNACDSSDQVSSPDTHNPHVTSLLAKCPMSAMALAHAKVQSRSDRQWAHSAAFWPAEDASGWSGPVDGGCGGSGDASGWEATAGRMQHADRPCGRCAQYPWRGAGKGTIRSWCVQACCSLLCMQPEHSCGVSMRWQST